MSYNLSYNYTRSFFKKQTAHYLTVYNFAALFLITYAGVYLLKALLFKAIFAAHLLHITYKKHMKTKQKEMIVMRYIIDYFSFLKDYLSIY